MVLTMQDDDRKPFRVLCFDGGGMRGLYSAQVLDTLITRIRGESSDQIDVGKAFDLIVGTSTGGILAIGLAHGLRLKSIINLYKKNGENIFSNPIPKKGLFNWGKWFFKRYTATNTGQTALRQALEEQFQDTTIKQLYDDRNIGVCIPAVRMETQRAWVFKTPHIFASEKHHAKNRDNNYKLVDVCIATAAAPIILPLVAIDNPNKQDCYDVFVDGGLWANNPTLIGLIEALEITHSKKDIQIISVSTASPPAGKVITKEELNYGLIDWKAGIGVLETSLEAQASGTHYMAHFIRPHLKTNVNLIRLAYDPPSNEQALLVGLDKADNRACKVLTDMTNSDVDHNILSDSSRTSAEDKLLIREIIESMPYFSI